MKIKELSDSVLDFSKDIFNISRGVFISGIKYPLETTIIDVDSGRVIDHYKPKDRGEKTYGALHHLKLMYVIGRESLLHPLSEIKIDIDTLGVTRINKNN